jgi:hypothetical protein
MGLFKTEQSPKALMRSVQDKYLGDAARNVPSSNNT